MLSRTRLRLLALPAALMALLAIAAPASAGAPGEGMPSMAVQPIACVEYDATAELPYITHWGYVSSSDEAVDIPIGPLNHFGEGEGANVGQPTTFLPGEHRDLFTTASDADSIARWTLDGWSPSVYSDYQDRCASITFLEKPAATTETTTATFGWEALVSGEENLWGGQVTRVAGAPEFRWTQWRDAKCTLDGVEFACAEQPSQTFSNIPAGTHTFTVEAMAPCDPWLEFPLRGEGSFCMTSEGPQTDRIWLGVSNENIARASYTWTVEGPKPQQPAAPVVVEQQQQQQTAPACLSRRSFSIRIRERKAQPIRRASVRVNGKAVKVSRKNGRLTAKVGLAALPKGRFAVKIVVRFRDGSKGSYTRRYRTCAPKLKPSNELSRKTAL